MSSRRSLIKLRRRSHTCPFRHLNSLASEFRQIHPSEFHSGEYFMSDKKKSAKEWQEKLEKQAEKSKESKRKREAAFVPPKEDTAGPSESDKATNDTKEIADLTKSLKKRQRISERVRHNKMF